MVAISELVYTNTILTPCYTLATFSWQRDHDHMHGITVSAEHAEVQHSITYSWFAAAQYSRNLHTRKVHKFVCYKSNCYEHAFIGNRVQNKGFITQTTILYIEKQNKKKQECLIISDCMYAFNLHRGRKSICSTYIQCPMKVASKGIRNTIIMSSNLVYSLSTQHGLGH